LKNLGEATDRHGRSGETARRSAVVQPGRGADGDELRPDASGVSGILNAISVASATLATMTDQVTTTLNELKQLDGNAAASFRNGLKQADSCKALPTTRTTTS
jgi:hypothetical protein